MGKAKGVQTDLVSPPAKGKSVKPKKQPSAENETLLIDRATPLPYKLPPLPPDPIPLLLRTVKLLDMTIEQLWGGRMSQDFKSLSVLRTDVKQLRNELEGMAP